MNQEHKLVDAYKRMLEHVHDALENVAHKTRPSLHEAVEEAGERLTAAGEITREEGERLGNYLKRDMEDAARFMLETNEDFREWLSIDLQLVENQLLEKLMGIADRTRVELAQLDRQAREASLYHAGEIAAPGTLQCVNCGQVIHLHTAGHIPPCPKCHQRTFKRIPSAVM